MGFKLAQPLELENVWRVCTSIGLPLVVGDVLLRIRALIGDILTWGVLAFGGRRPAITAVAGNIIPVDLIVG